MRRRTQTVRITRAAQVLWLVACASPSRPESAVDAYRAALLRDDPAAAYSLLSKEVRATLTFPQFAAQWRELRAERADQAKQLGSVRAVELHARVSSASSGGVELRDEGGGWRVHQSDWVGDAIHTPDGVMRALVRAVERRDYDAFVQLLSQKKRAKLDRAVKIRLDALRLALERPMEVEGDRVVIQVDPEHRLWLVREGGTWRIDDFE